MTKKTIWNKAPWACSEPSREARPLRAGEGPYRPVPAPLTRRQLYMQMDIQLVSIFSTTDSVRRSMSFGFLVAEASMRSTSSSFMMPV